MEEVFCEYSDGQKVFSILAPESMVVLVQDEAELGTGAKTFRFNWLVMEGPGIRVKVSSARIEAWHKHVTYTQTRTREEYAKEAVLLHEARWRQRFPENADSMIQWDKSMSQKEIPGGFIGIRFATWWGDNPLPHSFACFAAVSNNWMVTGTVEEEVPQNTVEIIKSFAFLPDPLLSQATPGTQGQVETGDWD